MSARWRPHGDVSAAMPSGEPFGLNGYASVDAPSASQYLRAAGGVVHVHDNAEKVIFISPGGWIDVFHSVTN